MQAMRYIIIISTVLCNLLFALNMLKAQAITAEELVGVWKLEQSGFIEQGKDVIKDFNACRLSQNFLFKDDGTLEYTYYEGDLDTCYVGEVENYQWRIEQDTLVLNTGEYIGYYVLKMLDDGCFRMEAVQMEKETTGDKMLDKLLNTVHFDVYRKRLAPVSCDQCKLVIKLN